MQRLESLSVDQAFRSRVQLVADRLDPDRANGLRISVDPRWEDFANQLDLLDRHTNSPLASLFVVGRPATVLRAIAGEHLEVGFVMPVAQMRAPRRKRWNVWSSRPASWRDDATLELWRAGWSPQDLDRLLVAGDGVAAEFVIGNARRTPEPGEADMTEKSVGSEPS